MAVLDSPRVVLSGERETKDERETTCFAFRVEVKRFYMGNKNSVLMQSCMFNGPFYFICSLE